MLYIKEIVELSGSKEIHEGLQSTRELLFSKNDGMHWEIRGNPNKNIISYISSSLETRLWRIKANYDRAQLTFFIFRFWIRPEAVDSAKE